MCCLAASPRQTDAVYDLDKQSSDLFMKNSVISDPEPLDQIVDISHLTDYEKNLFLPFLPNIQHSQTQYWKISILEMRGED